MYIIENVVSPIAVLGNTTPATIDASKSFAKMQPEAGVGIAGVNYYFEITTVNDIPKGGYFVLIIPTAIGVPSVGSLTLKCSLGCNSGAATMAWDSSKRELRVNSGFPTYLSGNSLITFDISGFTNPSTSDPVTIDFQTYAALSNGNYIIDQLIGDLEIKATQGFCTVNEIFPTDDNRIYAIPGNYTVDMSCVSTIEPLHGVRLTFPEEFYVV